MQTYRILYLLAAFAWLFLLWPYPITLFMAGAFACLTVPVFHKLCARFSRRNALLLYIAFTIALIVTPISFLILLVAPQAAAGFKMLNQLRESNFQLPPSWISFFQDIRNHLAEYPKIEKLVTDGIEQFDSTLGQLISIMVSNSFALVGGTMVYVWLLFLFVTMTTLFVASSKDLYAITRKILNITDNTLDNFVTAIHKALRGVSLGILLVAIIQGVLCGIGFAVAGVKQPAFWGLLATLVAPIPVVGTSLVWLPLCLYLWFSGSSFAAVGLALWGTIAVAGSDNILRPLFLRRGIDAPLFVLIISILCGLASFGAVGLIAGPVLLAFAIQAVKEGNRRSEHFFKEHV